MNSGDKVGRGGAGQKTVRMITNHDEGDLEFWKMLREKNEDQKGIRGKEKKRRKRRTQQHTRVTSRL
jgi:hypothetical protein